MISGRYRKLPVDVDAHQWFANGDHPDDRIGEELTDPLTGKTYAREEGAVVRRHPDRSSETRCGRCAGPMRDHGFMDTLEDGHTVCPSDVIITGVAGERYPCKLAIFLRTYEKVADAEEQTHDGGGHA